MSLARPLAEVAAGTIVCDAHIVERVPAAHAHRFWPRPDYPLTVWGDSMDCSTSIQSQESARAVA